MAADGSLNFDTRIDQSGFEKGTKNISNGVNKLKGTLKNLAKTAAASMPFSKGTRQIQKNIGGLTSSLKGLAGVAAAAFSIKQVVDFAKASKEAYNTQMEAEVKLETIMKQRMNATDDVIQSVKDLASEQQNLGVIGDEVQLAGAQQVATFVKESDSIKTLLPAMNDLLAQQNGLNASSGDAVNIANLMGKVLQGQTSALKRVGISFSDAEEQVLKYGTESERAAMLAQVITNNVGHMNQALAQTDAGKQTQLANTMGDVKEQFGQAVISIESAFLPLLARLVDGFSKVASMAQTAASAIRSAFGVKSDSNSATVAAATASSAASAASSYEDIEESAESTQKAQENSLASFDKVIKLNNSQQGAQNGQSAAGSAAAGGISTVPAGNAIAAGGWAEELKSSIKSGDWEGMGKLLAEKVNSAFDKVKWDGIKKKVTNGARKIALGINGFADNLNWKGIGSTLGEGINTAFSAAYTFLTTTKWKSIGSGFADFLNGLIGKTDFDKIGRTMGAKLNALIGLAFGFVTTFNFAEAGLSLSNLINGWIDEVNWDELGDTIGGMLQGAIEFAFNFVENINFEEAAESISHAFNHAIDKVDFGMLGQTVSDAFKGVWDFIATALEEIDWENVGTKIGDFISNINWLGILTSVFKAIGNVLKAAPQLLKGLVKSLDFGSAAALFGVLFAPKLAKSLLAKFTGETSVIAVLKNVGSTMVNKIKLGLSGAAGKIKEVAGTLAGKLKTNFTSGAEGVGSSFGSKLASGLGTAGAVIGAAVVGWNIGSKIYEQIKPGLDKATDALVDFFNKSDKIADEKIRERSQKTLELYHKKGYTNLKLSDVINNTEAFKAAYHAENAKSTAAKTNPASQLKTTINSAYDAAAAKKAADELWKRNASYYNKVPKFATGTVVPANYGEFAAILGDNKREPEVVSPVSTIEAAVRRVMAEQQSRQPAVINISLDTRSGKRLLTKQIIDDINDITKSTGKVPIKI